MHVEVGTTHVLSFLPVFRGLSMFCLIVNFDYPCDKQSKKWQKRFIYITLFWAILINVTVFYERKSTISEDFQRETKPREFDYERKTFSYWKRNRYLSNSRKIVCSHCNDSKTQDMVMTETHIREVSSFLLAKRVVFLVTVFFTFICFWGYCLKKSSKANLPSILFGRKRWC